MATAVLARADLTAARAFAAFVGSGDAAAFAVAFDATAQDLLLVATRLCRARQTMEDVLQDTWLQAIRRGRTFDPQRPLLPWLIGILIQEVRMRRRQERRRLARETHATQRRDAAGHGQADRDQPVAQAVTAECAEAVAAALDQLDPLHRQVVILRAFHGLDSFAIGRALGRPAHTVRSQLARGLSRLRRFLPPGHAPLAGIALDLADGPRLAAVKAHILARAAPAHAAAAGTVAVTWGVLLMPKLVLSGLVAVALVLLAFGAGWLGSADPVVAPAVAAAPARAAPDAAPRPGAAAADPAQDPRRAPVAPRPEPVGAAGVATATVVGRCVDELGQPLAQVAVTVHTTDETPAPQTTGADGRFALALRLVAPQPQEPPQITLQAEGRAPRHGPAWCDSDLVAGGAVDLGDLVLPAATPVRGRLVDPRGVPQRVPRGQVVARAPETRLDRWPADLQYGGVTLSGASEFTTAPLRHGPWQLQLMAKGWFAAPVILRHAAGAEPVTLVVEPVPALRGVVVDGRDRPVAGVAVSVALRKRITAMNTMHAVTDAAGRFALDSDGYHAPGEGVDVVAYDGRGRFGSARVAATFGGPELRLVLPELRALQVQVVDDQSGVPMAGAVVGWHGDPQAVLAAASVPAPAGVADLKGLPEAPVAVFAIGPDATWRVARATATGRVASVAASGPDLVLRLGPAPVVWLRVRRGAEPVAGARVELLDPLACEPGGDTVVLPTVCSGGAGQFVDRAAACLLLGSATTGADGTAPVPLQGDRPALLARITGAGCAPTVLRAPFGKGAGTEGDPWLCQVAAPGTVLVRIRGTSRRDLRLVLTQDQGAGIHVFPAPGQPVAPDAAGRAWFSGVPAGVWQVRAAALGEAFHRLGAPSECATVAAVAGSTAEVVVEAEALRPARLDVVLEPARDDALTLQALAGASEQVHHEWTLDPIAGHLATSDLFPGRYRLVRAADGATTTLELRAGETRRGTLPLGAR